MNCRRKIHRLAVLQGWLEADLLRCPDGCLIQTVTEPFGHANDLHRAGGRKDYVDEHVALETEFPRFLGVLRVRLLKDDHFGDGRRVVRLLGFRRRGVHRRRWKPPAWTLRPVPLGAVGAMATPLPKPELATVPRTPLAPPVPLP